MSHQKRLLKLKELLVITGLSRASIYRLEHLGKFPKRVRLSERAVAWHEEDVQQWIDSRERVTQEPLPGAA